MMAPSVLNAMIPRLGQYLRYLSNEINFSSAMITFDRLYQTSAKYTQLASIHCTHYTSQVGKFGSQSGLKLTFHWNPAPESPMTGAIGTAWNQAQKRAGWCDTQQKEFQSMSPLQRCMQVGNPIEVC